jgi:hypothetical protein
MAFLCPGWEGSVQATIKSGIDLPPPWPAQVDIVVDESYYLAGLAGLTLANFTTDYGFTASDATTIKFLANKAVYRFDGLVSEAEGLDWFETAVARPDLVGGPGCVCAGCVCAGCVCAGVQGGVL